GLAPVPDTPVERLYRTIYLLLPHYMIALLKVLLAAAPTSRARSEPIDILDEVVPKEPVAGVVESSLLNLDVDRHKEITVKAISGLMLLLLKQLKLNHIYQFEYVSQQLVFANCIPLILKFFNQNIVTYVRARNSSPALDFPGYFIGDRVELSLDLLSNSLSGSNCSWRNMFSCINLMRILCKSCKWKHARTIMMVAFKSATILKRVLHVRNAMLQLYALKLLKSQSRYFGRQWRKNNMAIMSAIYQKVRHRLTDDWAYGNEVDARPLDFQTDECTLRTNVDSFNARRYTKFWCDTEVAPLDNSLVSVLNQHIELPEEFKLNYEAWLEREVFSKESNWDLILSLSTKASNIHAEQIRSVD
ncbi:Striatin-interacting protein 2, partial [Cichlidogyrus casuarinus]